LLEVMTSRRFSAPWRVEQIEFTFVEIAGEYCAVCRALIFKGSSPTHWA
jgi:hypothetical protein